MDLSYFRLHTEPALQVIVNEISLGCAIVTLFLVIILVYFRPHIFNRASLRFQGIIALIDILRHIVYANKTLPEGPLCTFVGFLSFFFDHVYLFANMIITINVQFLYFHNMPPQREIELLLIAVAIMAAVVINIIPFAFEFYGRSRFGVCDIKAYAKDQLFFKTVLIYFVNSAVLIYCLIIFIVVFMFLKLRKSYIEEKFPNKTIILFGEIINARKFIQRLYFRMAMYPLSAFICFSPQILGGMFFDAYQYFPDWMYFSMRFGLRFTGTLNLLALLFDPHFQLAIVNIWKNGLFFSQVDRKELHNDVDLKTIKDLKVEDDCLIEFPGQEILNSKNLLNMFDKELK